jgi:DSBA-like thioredoxin domain
MAANAQGKFWQMHDKLFENQQKLDRADLDGYAQAIGLNMAKYKADMDGHKYKDQIDADSKRGNEVGANGTPTFFINGKLLSGAQPFESFKSVIEEEIKHADEVMKKGVPLDKVYDEILKSLPTAPPSPGGPTGAQGAAPPPEKVDVQVGDAPSKGPKNAVITLLEFSDFQ